MTVETATYISDLNAAYPGAADVESEGDDHLRLLKSTIKATFPNVAGVVTPTHTELGYVAGVTSAIQTQLNTLTTNVGTATTNASAAQTTANAAMPKAGGTFTGAVTLNADPASALQPATKQYVDNGTKTSSQISDSTATGRSLLTAASSAAATAVLSTMVASGASHAAGLVPDPGAVSGTSKFLREDGTWQAPSSGGGLTQIGTITATGASTADLTTGTWTGYREIWLEFDNLAITGAASNLSIFISNDSGATWSTINGTLVNLTSSATTYGGFVKITNAQTATAGAVIMHGVIGASTPSANQMFAMAVGKSGPINAVRLSVVTATFTTTNVRVWGLK